MRQLGLIPDLSSEPRTSFSFLFQAVLANLENAISRRHVTVDAARDFFDRLVARVRPHAAGSDFSSLEVETVFKQATYAFADLVADSYLQREGALTCDVNLRAFTIKPLFKIQAWLDDSQVLDAKAPESARVARVCCDMFADPAKRSTNKLCGANEVLWFSPYTAEIQREFESLDSQFEDEVELLPNATRLRNKLGLFNRRHGQHLVAAVTRKSIRELCRSSRCAAAPTVFDAWTYERYRHWPPMGDVSSYDNIGRSYELDTGRKLPGAAGAGLAEFVTVPLELDDVERLIYIGVVRDNSRYDEPVDHERYAASVAGSRKPDLLLTQLADRLGF